jgi:hypothetical protein
MAKPCRSLLVYRLSIGGGYISDGPLSAGVHDLTAGPGWAAVVIGEFFSAGDNCR